MHKKKYYIFQFLITCFFLILPIFIAVTNSCAYKNVDKKLFFPTPNPSLCYKYGENITFTLQTDSPNKINVNDFIITSSFGTVSNDIKIIKSSTTTDAFVGNIYINYDENNFSGIFYDCYLWWKKLSCHFFLVKFPKIEIKRVLGSTDDLDKLDSATYQFSTDVQWAWPIMWKWDQSLPNWCNFLPNYNKNEISITNNNNDVYDFSNYMSSLTCEYGPATKNYSFALINTNNVNPVPSSVFIFDEEKNIIGFNTSQLSLAAYDTIVIPQYASNILDCVNADSGIISSISPITKVIFDSQSNCERIGNFSFAKNNTLQTIVFSKQIDEIGRGAFEECPQLKNIHFLSSSPPKSIGVLAFDNVVGRRVFVPNVYKEFYDVPWFLSALQITAENLIGE